MEGADFQVLSQDAVGARSHLFVHSAHGVWCLQWQNASFRVGVGQAGAEQGKEKALPYQIEF